MKTRINVRLFLLACLCQTSILVGYDMPIGKQTPLQAHIQSILKRMSQPAQQPAAYTQPQQSLQASPPPPPPVQPPAAQEQPPVAATPYQAPTPRDGLELRGCIKVGQYCDRVPQYRIHFQGKETVSNSEGFFSVPIDQSDLSKYSLVICKTFEQHFEQSNTIKNFAVIPDKNYRYFSFKRGDDGSWVAYEKQLVKKNFMIPDHSIIISIDPKYIDRVEAWNIQLPPNVVRLPAIYLKDDVERDVLARSSAKSLLYSLDKKLFHETINEEKKIPENNPKVHISLAP